MLYQNENNPNMDHSLRIKSIKVILSAMWFTDTAGVENILVEYKPPISELQTAAYRYYSAIFRLCYSFHSSLAEIVDFVQTLQPKKLFSIALPESTSEKQINSRFYDANGRFVGYRIDSIDSSKSEVGSNNENIGLWKSDKLVLRKRKSCDLSNNHIDGSNTSDSNENSSDDGLIFDDDTTNERDQKKFKFTN